MQILEFSDRIVPRAWVRRRGRKVIVHELPVARHRFFWAGTLMFLLLFAFIGSLFPATMHFNLFGRVFGILLFLLPTAGWGLALLPWNARLVIDLQLRRALVEWRFLSHSFRAQSFSLEGAILAEGIGEHPVPVQETPGAMLLRDVALHAAGLALAGPFLADMTTEQVPALVLRCAEGNQALLLTTPPVTRRILDTVPELGTQSF